MSINSIGVLGGHFCVKNGLSEETKQKLIAFGIDPSTVASEAQAKILIENITKIQNIQKSASVNTSNSCTSECELISRAKILAKKLGILISNNMKTDAMLEVLSVAINKKLSEPNQNEKTLQNINNCQQELSLLKEEFSVIKQNENAMFASMNFNASMNKMMLGLN